MNSIQTQENFVENQNQDNDELYFDHEINPDNQIEYHGQHNKEGQYHGEGIQVYQNSKCFFKGFWSKGKKIKGIEIFPNSDKYEGDYQDDFFHGFGCLTNKQVGYSYTGDFVKGKKEGNGKETFKSGGEYEGEFKNDYRHGKGVLKFSDGRQYEGDFVKGVPQGFGIYEAQDYESMKSLLPDPNRQKQLQMENKNNQNENLNNLLNQNKQEQPVTNIIKEKEIQDDEDEDIYIFDYQEVENKDQNAKKYYYEGEFIDGYKHGLGRQYEPDGSYYYCQWEYNRKTGNIIYYNASSHKWSYFYYNSPQNVTDFYLSPNDKQVEKFITYIHKEESGFPPEELDAYKQKIDECGIFGDQFEDQNFPSIEQSINQNMQVEQQRELPPIDFHRISELQQFKKKLEQQNKNLFEKPIEPGQIVYNKCSDQQLLACIESLSRFPQLLQKVFTIKYELENVCFITLRLYSKGQWLEQVIDDFVPCYKVSRECIFANTQYNDLGWIALQKVFSKYFGSYLYFYEPNFPKKASQYLQMMTGLPCKTITWNSLDISEDSHNQGPKKLKAKIFDKINSQKNQSKVGIAYLNKEYANMYGFSENTAYSIIDKLKFEDDSDNQGKESMYILLHNNVPEFKIESKSYNKNKLWERPEMKAFYKKNNMTKLGDKFMMLEIDEFLRQFNEINLLIGYPMMVQNNQFIEAEIKDYVHTDNRFYFKFQLSLPQRILINVQQHSKNNDEYLPVRMVLAKEIGTYLNNKAEFIKQKFVTDMVKQNQEGNLKKKRDKNRLSIQKSQKNIESQNQIQNQSQLTESKKQDNEQLKKKQLKYQYVFGKGQLKKENMYKYINLEAGSYVILIQAEGPDTKSESQKNQTMQKINFTMSLFTESLLKISKFQENENFLRNLYEQCIISAEQKVLESEGVQIEHFTRSDLQEREQGCNDLINTQYFLYKEGTYLQYLQNQSSEQSSKSWRQKLYFRTENMKILDQPDPHKVDLYLLPGTESLIIIQQIGAKPFKLEGGEGICIIEKIGKNKNQDLYKLGTSDNITKNDDMQEKYMASGNLAELEQEQQDDSSKNINLN